MNCHLHWVAQPIRSIELPNPCKCRLNPDMMEEEAVAIARFPALGAYVASQGIHENLLVLVVCMDCISYCKSFCRSLVCVRSAQLRLSLLNY